MVGHKAVRNYFNVPAIRGTQKLRAYALSDCGVREVFVPLERAHREENTLRTDVTIIRKARRAAVKHPPHRANSGPPLG
jgi:hypothetical protein